MRHLPALSSSAKADDPVVRSDVDPPQAPGILGAPPSRGMTIRNEKCSSASLLLALEHGEHALRHQEAAENIDGRKSERDEAERARPQRAIVITGQRDSDREQ